MIFAQKEIIKILESYSKTTLEFVEYELNERGEMTVENETAHLYRYWARPRSPNFYTPA